MTQNRARPHRPPHRRLRPPLQVQGLQGGPLQVPPDQGHGHQAPPEGRCRTFCPRLSLLIFPDHPLSNHCDTFQLTSKSPQGFQNCIAKYTNDKVKLNENQYGALVSWAFNVGCGNAQGSQLVKRLNKGESPAKVLPAELPKWRLAGGKVMPGLVRRRAAEVKLSKVKTTKGALPPKC